MADPNPFSRSNVQTQSGEQAGVNEGLRQYMLKVYNTMALGVGFTGLVTLLMANSPQLMYAVAVGPMKWVLFIGLLGLGWMAPKIIMTGSKTAAHACFWVYAGLWGVLISPMIVYFLQTPGGALDIAKAFFITAGMFAGASLYGYTTKRDLSPFGRFLMMAVIGLLIAMVANIFIGSGGFGLLISCGIVLIFAGMTAYETQMIRDMYYQAGSSKIAARMAIFGAMMLYGSFITMFIHILSIIGIMRSE